MKGIKIVEDIKNNGVLLDDVFFSNEQWLAINNLINFYKIDNDKKDHRIAVLERALKLACEPRDDWSGKEYDEPYTNYYDYFIDQAEKELKDE